GFTSDQVIEESLRANSVRHPDPGPAELANAVDTPRAALGALELCTDPLFGWLERHVALKPDGEGYQRGPAMTVGEMGRHLSEAAGRDQSRCESALKDLFARIAAVNERIAR